MDDLTILVIMLFVCPPSILLVWGLIGVLLEAW